MTWGEFLIVFAICALTMLVCRVLPMFILKGRELPRKVEEALGYIPPAAFAALVANDLITPGAFAANPLMAVIPFLASLVVVIVALKTKSLILCAVVGVAAYALFSIAIYLFAFGMSPF